MTRRVAYPFAAGRRNARKSGAKHGSPRWGSASISRHNPRLHRRKAALTPWRVPRCLVVP
jgi:hypothetical protein